jgi:hypothetical protein
MRPPQPVPEAALETALCHCACWSACEYSDKGRNPAAYCACVVGCSKVPTLARIAMRFWLNSICRSVSDGCSPNGEAESIGWIGSSDACDRLIPDVAGRIAAYWP